MATLTTTRPLRIATWNVNEGVRRDKSDGDQTTFDNVLDAIAVFDIDILALQEVRFEVDGRSRLLDAVRRNTHLTQSVDAPLSVSSFSSGAEVGLAVLSCFPIVRNREHRFVNPNLRAVWNGREMRSHDKGVLVGTVDTAIGQVDVGSVHVFPFHRFGRGADDSEFRAVWGSLAQGLSQSSGRPLILAGDFNTPRRELVHGALTRRLSSALGGRPTHAGAAIDDILYSSDFATREPAQVVDTFSDHDLCIATLQPAGPR